MGYICQETIKNFQSCPFAVYLVVTNGGPPAKFTPQKHKRKHRPAQYMRPGTEKSPPAQKRNRELPNNSPIFSIFAVSFYPVSLSVLDRRARIRSGAVFRYGCNTRILAAISGRFLHK